MSLSTSTTVSGELGAASSSISDGEVEIREVWADNLEAEFATIGELIDNFPIVAMDTEFPGTAVSLLLPDDLPTSDRSYLDIRANVGLLHLIQLGLALSDSRGRLAAGRVWQFNFREFDPDGADPHDPTALPFLAAAGIDLADHRARGVDVVHFAKLLMSSGALLNDNVSWVTFHGAYDVGYLLKALTGEAMLPPTRHDFLELSKTYFRTMYDVKDLVRYYAAKTLYGGLEKVARDLGVARVGTAHQAGSDALLTLRCFLVMMQDGQFAKRIESYDGVLYGLSDDFRKQLAKQ